ncbi:sigma-70 family RNA polymerase sigma factor [Streptomyces sp. NPDC051907]|uniref:sigma-70 family RNA polymerase sigma factor n=1 Tax=Streptomyces sp. NPDC051907 TaxID=3155284 RepID=UPI00342D394D
MSTSQKHLSRPHRSDEELAAAIRHGDAGEEELAELYGRHRPAVRAYAGTCCRDSHTAEDLASEAFVRAIAAVRAGHGPRGSWRPYLLTTVRNIAITWTTTSRRTELTDEIDDWAQEGSHTEEFALRNEEDDIVVRSFRQLPERWQAVLWHTAVEREPVSRVGPMLGLSESGVRSLAERAREGLREAYLSVHASSGVQDSDECAHYRGLLAAAVRRPGRRTSKDFSRHLDACARCRRTMSDLVDLNSRLRAVLPAAVLLWGGSRYLGAQGAPAGAAASASVLPDPSGGAASFLSSSTLKGAALTVAVATAGAAAIVILGPEQQALPSKPPPAASRPAHPTASTPAPSAASPSPSREPKPPSAPTPTRSRATSQPGPSSSPVAPSAAPAPDPTLREAGSTTLRVPSSGRCVEAATSAAGEAVREADCDGSDRQVWVQLHFEGPTVLLRNAVSGLCLRDTGGSAADVQLACDSGERRQVWRTEYSLEASSLVVTGSEGGMYEI